MMLMKWASYATPISCKRVKTITDAGTATCTQCSSPTKPAGSAPPGGLVTRWEGEATNLEQRGNLNAVWRRQRVELERVISLGKLCLMLGPSRGLALL